MSRNFPILITGCQRSGTTLLSLIMDSHPEITSIDELEFDLQSLNIYLNHSDYHPYVSFKLPIASHAIQSFKNTDNMKILWCVRDPRDVVASMVKLNLQFNNNYIPWAAHPSGAESEIRNTVATIQHIIGYETKKQLNAYNQILQKKPSQRSTLELVFTSALCWNLKQLTLEHYKDLEVEYQIVTYEDLITNPKEHIGEIMTFLGVKWHDDLLKHHLLHSGVSVGNTTNSRPIDPNNTDKWKKTFTEQDADIVRHICFDLAQKFGYEI